MAGEAGADAVAAVELTGPRWPLERRHRSSKEEEGGDNGAAAGCVCRMRLERSVVCAANADRLLPINMVAFLIGDYESNAHGMQKIFAPCMHH